MLAMARIHQRLDQRFHGPARAHEWPEGSQKQHLGSHGNGATILASEDIVEGSHRAFNTSELMISFRDLASCSGRSLGHDATQRRAEPRSATTFCSASRWAVPSPQSPLPRGMDRLAQGSGLNPHDPVQRQQEPARSRRARCLPWVSPGTETPSPQPPEPNDPGLDQATSCSSRWPSTWR